jgi:hypothetical protein
MTIKEFDKLSEHERYDIIFTQGDFIEYWFEENQRFALYAIFMFYVEVEYNPIDNKIINMISFDDGELLDKYAFFRKSDN